jgi:AcrR family transcriptional regulator
VPVTRLGRRVDAERNRELLVAAAASIFGESGLDAPMDAIARRAGVGNATLYRNFPHREDLVAAVFVDQLLDWAEAAKTAARSPDPWIGLRDYVRAICALQAQNRGLADLLVSDVASDERIVQLRRSAWRSTLRVVRRAQRSGALRADVEPQDVRMIFTANAGVVAHSGANTEARSARLAELLLAGLANTAD